MKYIILCIVFLLFSTACFAISGEESPTSGFRLKRTVNFLTLDRAEKELTENPELTSILLSAGYAGGVEIWSITMVRNSDGSFSVVNKENGIEVDNSTSRMGQSYNHAVSY